MASSSNSESKKLPDLLRSDIAKKVLQENRAFFKSWWRAWEEWNKKNELLLEMIEEEKKRQGGY